MTADPAKLKIAKDLARNDTIFFALARRPDSSDVFFGASDFKVYRCNWAAEKAELVEIARHESYVTAVALAGNNLVSGGYDQKLVWTNVDDGKCVRSIDGHQSRIRQIVASPDGKTVASVADDMVCRVWDVGSGKLVHELRGHEAMTPHHYPSMLYACAYSADGKHLATGDKVGHVVVWDAATGKQVAALEASGMYTWDPTQRRHSIGGIRSVAFSPDGTKLVAGGIGKIGNIDHLDAPARLEVFDWKKGERTHEILADGKLKGLVEQIRFHPSGEWLVAAGGGTGGVILFCDVNAGKIVFQDTAPMHVHGIATNEACDTIYAAGHHKLVVWELKAAEPAVEKT